MTDPDDLANQIAALTIAIATEQRQPDGLRDDRWLAHATAQVAHFEAQLRALREVMS